MYIFHQMLRSYYPISIACILFYNLHWYRNNFAATKIWSRNDTTTSNNALLYFPGVEMPKFRTSPPFGVFSTNKNTFLGILLTFVFSSYVIQELMARFMELKFWEWSRNSPWCWSLLFSTWSTTTESLAIFYERLFQRSDQISI